MNKTTDSESGNMASRGFFITGTDTGVGKTLIATALINLLVEQGNKVAGMKPVSCGCLQVDGQWQHDDAQLMMAASNIKLPYEVINPYAFEPAIAPHLAALQVGETISISLVHEKFRILSDVADKIVIEGAGGWLVPINNKESMADLAVALGLPVILVVGLRLGCLNHALLTTQSILEKGGELAGWVANSIDPLFKHQKDNINTLKTRIPAPCLGVIPFRDQLGEDHDNRLTQISDISRMLIVDQA
ncbi:MAG: dethiobiotin synthase [Acidiferrobacterales bacterium]